MKVTINKLASKRLLEAFAKVGACRTEEQAEARMSKLLGVPVHVIYYRSEEITEIDMRAATGPWQEVRAQRRRPYGGRWIEIL